MKPLKIGVVGFRHGHMADLVERAARHPETEIAAAWEQDPAARQWAERTLGIRITHEDPWALMESDVDIVAVGDVFARRGALAIAALRAGKHVLLDKPVCISLEELAEMERLALEKRRAIGAMLDLRDRPTLRTARRLMVENVIGRVHAVQLSGQHPLNYGSRPAWYFQPGMHGGTLNDLGVHGVDAVRWLTGAELTTVAAARCWNAFATEAPHFRDCAQFMAVFSGGMGVMGDVSYSAPSTKGYTIEPYWRFTLWGTDGMMEFNLARPEVAVCRNGSVQPERIAAAASEDSYFDDFIREVLGEKALLNTHEVLASSRTALQLQAAADGE